MRKRFVIGYTLAVTLCAVSLVVAQNTAPAPGAAKGQKGKGKGRGGPATPAGPTPHLTDGTVDLSGAWMGSGSNSGDISKGLKPGEQVIMQPWAEALDEDAEIPGRSGGELPADRCSPRRSVSVADRPNARSATSYSFEGNIHSFRQIFMNGKHPDDPDPTWYGHSIGTWDKDTLVVDSVGFNDKFWFDYLGHPHTEKLHTIERYTRTDLGNMTIEVTIDDPGAYTKPFTTIGPRAAPAQHGTHRIHLPGKQHRPGARERTRAASVNGS